MKAISIPTSKSKYYRQLFEFLRPISPFSKLNNRDLDILSVMLTEYMGLKGLNHEQRCQYVFSTEVRQKLQNKIKVSQAAYNNSVSKFKKLGLIERKNYFNGRFMASLRPEKKLEILFKWKAEN